MQKTALIIHGWPQPVTKDHPLYQELVNLGYEVVSPVLFAPGIKFDFEEIQEKIKNNIQDKEVHLAIGISLGGLILPAIASDMPKAKLIFIATGPRFAPNSLPFKSVELLSELPALNLIINSVKKLPLGITAKAYQLISPYRIINGKKKNVFITETEDNIRYIFKLDNETIKGVLNFIKEADNREILKNLDNQALILSGCEDSLMPLNLSEELCRLLRNSKLEVAECTHFDVINQDTLWKIKDFAVS